MEEEEADLSSNTTDSQYSKQITEKNTEKSMCFYSYCMYLNHIQGF